jgi:diacylglycerol kinase family enzyme
MALPAPAGAVSVSRAQQFAAAVTLLASIIVVGFAVYVAVSRFPAGLVTLACVAVALVGSWFAVARRGRPRVIGIVVTVLALVGVVVLLFRNGGWPYLTVLVVCVAIVNLASRRAFRAHVRLAAAEPPRKPVLFVNPWSGGGKAAKVGLVEEAAARGIATVELRSGDDLEVLVRDAVAEGADGLAAAGGDGTQAVVATVAAEHGLPYACIPAGTRNHFALDLGVDRDDVVGALDAFTDGREHRVDLGEVNGRVFVNNVSMGLYAVAVQKKGYRDAKIRTLLDTAPTVLGPTGPGLDLRWVAADGTAHASAATILVSNNPYRLGHAVGSGTRPRIDLGRLGIAVVQTGDTSRGGNHGLSSLLLQWSASEFRVDSAQSVPVGVDGEAMTLEPPIRFRTRHGVLRVRISPRHPGASPSAIQPDRVRESFRALAAIAAGQVPSNVGLVAAGSSRS